MIKAKVYVGDSVYAAFDGFNFILTTEDGVDVTNIIMLEPLVVRCLMSFIKKIEEEVNEKR